MSTQMTVTGSEGAAFLKERGATRVVPARELSLEEVRRMKKKPEWKSSALCTERFVIVIPVSVS